MQTFITHFNPNINAKNLDQSRLGKQRVEAIQIAECILVKPNKWKNHPAVNMWRGYEPYLLLEYLPPIFEEWCSKRKKNGEFFSNEKCGIRYEKLLSLIRNKKIVKPFWLSPTFIKHHRSNLIRKNPKYYGKLWPNISGNLEYIWPG